MDECYQAALAANTTTVISVTVGMIVGIILYEVVASLFEWRRLRKERRLLDTMLTADTSNHQTTGK